jgi:eukaryotic-like serine/threonine-protein kinase
VTRIGNYRLGEERGRDASGTVHEARHIVLPRRAIVKVMEASEARPLALQLLREACILEALEHPGIVRVYESGLLADRRPWFAHELIEGATVEDLIAAGPLEPANAVTLLRDIADVLEHAHRRGIVHCNLRPDGIVITGRTRGFPLCLVDWSEARTHDTSSRGPVPVLREYVAPELVLGGAIDDRVDVFSLGVIAYQALTGVLPFDGQTTAMDSDGAARHVPTTVRCPEAPPELTTLVDQMLAADRWDRPSSAEVHAELIELARELAEPPPVAVPGQSGMRMRKPRWTPSIPMSDADSDLVALDAIVVDAPEKSS